MRDQDKHSFDYRMASAQRIAEMADRVFARQCADLGIYLPLAVRRPLDAIIESEVDADWTKT